MMKLIYCYLGLHDWRHHAIRRRYCDRCGKLQSRPPYGGAWENRSDEGTFHSK